MTMSRPQTPVSAITMHTREEVARHNRSTDLWVIIDKKVYDLTDFQAEHPGGDRILRKLGGQDASKEFHENHRQSLLARYKERLQVGVVETGIPAKKRLLSRWFG